MTSCRKTKVTNWMNKFYKLNGGDWGMKNKTEYTNADKDFFYRIVFIDGVPNGDVASSSPFGTPSMKTMR